jgi:hypothetical protein
LIQLEAGGSAPVLRYDIPEPTSYTGPNLIELNFDGDIFSAAALVMPSNDESGDRLSELPLEAVRSEVAEYLRTGASSRVELPNLPVGVRPTSIVSATAGVTSIAADQPGSTPPPDLDEDDLADILGARLKLGYRLTVSSDFAGDPKVTPLPPVPPTPDPRLYLVETMRLTSVLGDYGAGRIVKTFSLLPGETTKISMKTFRSTESTRKAASSVLDSLTKESATDLETSLSSEQSDQRSFEKSQEYYAEVSGKATWGWGSAEGKAGVKGSSNSARQEAVKNVSNATQKHSAKASAKREVEVNTSFEVTEKSGEELSIERSIENINLSRTLNFVFRQMNQEFVTFLHLTDVRVGFFNGDGKSRREVPLSGLEGLLQEVVKPASRDNVRDIILEQLSAVRDYDGNPVNVVETVQVTPGDTYRQFDSDLVTTFTDLRGREHMVQGVLLKADHLVMRTEGVIVEALLGNGTALDSYAEKLQGLEVERRAALVEHDKLTAAQLELINEVISSGDTAKAAIAERLCRCHCRCADEHGDSDGTKASAKPADK